MKLQTVSLIGVIALSCSLLSACGSKEEEQKTAFSTSSYHVCRGGILAEEMGWNIDGMGSRTKWYFWPNAFLREFIGLLAESWVQQMVAVAVIAVLSGLLTVIM